MASINLHFYIILAELNQIYGAHSIKKRKHLKNLTPVCPWINSPCRLTTINISQRFL